MINIIRVGGFPLSLTQLYKDILVNTHQIELLDSRWISGFTMDAWGHDGFLYLSKHFGSKNVRVKVRTPLPQPPPL